MAARRLPIDDPSMAAFPRDQDFLEDSSLPVAQRGAGSGSISTFPDYFHLPRSRYDVIGVPDFEGIELVPPGAAAPGTNYNISILANYDGLTPLLEKLLQSNAHGACFPDHIRGSNAEEGESPLIPSDSPEPNLNLPQQLPVPRAGNAGVDPRQCRIPDDDGTNLEQSMECKKRKSDRIPGGEHKKSRPSLEEHGTKTGAEGPSLRCHKNAKVKPKPDPPTDYIHVRARRGQATDSHSLAERVRREKISERMRKLQDLVPGCNKVTGKAVMLDEIINYIQSLQNQVEFLSMKLASLNPRFSHLGLLDGFLELCWPSQELSPLQGSGSTTDPSAVYQAAGNFAEGDHHHHHQPLLQHQMPCALDMAFPTTIAAYNSLPDRQRLASAIDGIVAGFSQVYIWGCCSSVAVTRPGDDATICPSVGEQLTPHSPIFCP